MTQRTDLGVEDSGLSGTLDEIRDFLNTWFFSVSEMGHFYVRPQASTVGWKEFSAFLRRLELLHDHGYPSLTTLDFSGVEVARVDRIRITEAVLKFARDAGATAVVRPRGEAGGYVILIAMPAEAKKGQSPMAQPVLMESA